MATLNAGDTPAPRPAAGSAVPDTAEKTRIILGAAIIASGFVLVGVIALVAMFQFDDAKDVTAVLGSVTGVVGTVVGAYFGVHVGAAGKEQAEAGRREAEQKANTFALAVDATNQTAQNVLRASGLMQ